MLTLVGTDRPGIVARVTDALYRAGWNLGEASMMRLGGNFTIMLMVSGQGSRGDLEDVVRPAAQALGLQVHVDSIEGGLHRHVVPNIQVRVSGADRAGIVAKVTGALASTGFNILDSEERPVYIMCIQGYAEATVEELEQAVRSIGEEGVEVRISPIETLIG